MKRKSQGFTMVELMLVTLIMVILSMIVIGIMNPDAIMNKARDARKKKDMGRIKVAFEEYINDKQCYPDAAMIALLTDRGNCDSSIFAPWLDRWPCDPGGQPYYLVAENDDCPNWFMVMGKLDNDRDPDIPSNWGVYGGNYTIGDGTYTPNQVNFGASSTNVNWYEMGVPERCIVSGACFYRPPSGGCNTAEIRDGDGSMKAGCVGPNCYGDNDCSDTCQLTCCGIGCD